MAGAKDQVSIKESHAIDNRTQPGTSRTEYQVTSSTTGQMIAGGSGETKSEARSSLRGAMIAAGWTGDEVDQLFTEYDAAMAAPNPYPKTYPIR